MTDYTELEKEVDVLDDTIWDMASKVWDFAELGFEEQKSSAYESAVLEKNGFKITDRGVGGIGTSWVASWGSGSPVLGILVEFDALPGLGNDTVPNKTPAKNGNTNGHGCGHNLIGSGAIGAAPALKSHLEKEKIAGTIKVFGCPAEELMAGKNYMAQTGAFDSLDACLHHHPGPINAVEAGGLTDVGDVSWCTPTMGAIFASWPMGIPPTQRTRSLVHYLKTKQRRNTRSEHDFCKTHRMNHAHSD